MNKNNIIIEIQNSLNDQLNDLNTRCKAISQEISTAHYCRCFTLEQTNISLSYELDRLSRSIEVTCNMFIELDQKSLTADVNLIRYILKQNADKIETAFENERRSRELEEYKKHQREAEAEENLKRKNRCWITNLFN